MFRCVLLVWVFLFNSFRLLAAGPSDAADLAASDISSLPPAIQQTTRYISFYNTSSDERQRLHQKFVLTLNSVSRAQTIYLPPWVNDQRSLIRLDLTKILMEPQTWDSLWDQHTSFNIARDSKVILAPWLNAQALSNLASLKSIYPILRADYFCDRILQPQNYRRALRISTFDSFQHLTGWRPNPDFALAAIITFSQVSVHNQMIVAEPTAFGHGYAAYFTTKSTGDRDFIRWLTDAMHDQVLYMAPLPNRLWCFYITDVKKQPLDFLSPELALDPGEKKPGFLKLSASCLRCHSHGPEPFKDLVRTGSTRVLGISSKDPEKSALMVKLFSVDLPIESDRKATDDPLSKIFYLNTPVLDFSHTSKPVVLVAKPLVSYDTDKTTYDSPITLEVALLETGLTRNQLKMVFMALRDNHLAVLFANRPIRRDQWELLFPRIMLSTLAGAH